MVCVYFFHLFPVGERGRHGEITQASLDESTAIIVPCIRTHVGGCNSLACDGEVQVAQLLGVLRAQNKQDRQSAREGGGGEGGEWGANTTYHSVVTILVQCFE